MSSNGKLKFSGASVVKAGSWETGQRCISGHPAVGTGIFSSNCWSRKLGGMWSSSPEDDSSESYKSMIPNRCGAKSGNLFHSMPYSSSEVGLANG